MFESSRGYRAGPRDGRGHHDRITRRPPASPGRLSRPHSWPAPIPVKVEPMAGLEFTLLILLALGAFLLNATGEAPTEP